MPRWKDIRDVSIDAVRRACGESGESGGVELIVGGFACQDISVAGSGAGLAKTTRSGLTWREMFRLIRGLRPANLLIENVPALRSRGIDRVIAVLERIGYACRALVVGAWAVGAPHKRDRVWIIGRFMANTIGRDCGGGLPESLRESQGGVASDRTGDQCVGQKHATHSCRSINTNDFEPSCAKLGYSARLGKRKPANQADALAVDRAARDESGDAGEAVADANRSPLRIERECAGGDRAASAFIGWPSGPGQPQHGWEAARLAQFGLGGAVDGPSVRLARFANRNALKALGNAVVPQVAEMIGRMILANRSTGGTA